MMTHLAAVAFIPPRDVLGAYEVLLDSRFFMDNSDLLEPFINYVYLRKGKTCLLLYSVE